MFPRAGPGADRARYTLDGNECQNHGWIRTMSKSLPALDAPYGLRHLRKAGQLCGWLMLTIQGMPKRSVHMPNTSPHICRSSGTETEPSADSFSQ